jgi:hypothetical protein
MKKTAENTLKRVAQKKPIVMSEIMVESGYSPTTAINPGKNLTNKPVWKELMSELVNDELIIKRINRALISDDNRAALQAADMLLKLKDRYPAGKLKVQEYNEELERLQG